MQHGSSSREDSLCLLYVLQGYSSILQGIAPRFQNSASSGEVAPRERVAISIRSQLHACCQVETRRDAILMEMRRKVSRSCDIGIDVFGLQTFNSPARPSTSHTTLVACQVQTQAPGTPKRHLPACA